MTMRQRRKLLQSIIGAHMRTEAALQEELWQWEDHANAADFDDDLPGCCQCGDSGYVDSDDELWDGAPEVPCPRCNAGGA